MTAFLPWYLILTLLGWLTFPLVYHLFPMLTDRGFTLARTAGLLIWGYVFFSGLVVPAVRSALMGSFVLVGNILERPPDSIVGLTLLASLFLAVTPSLAVDMSFLLSFAITEFKPLEAITVQTSVPVSPLFNPAAAPTLFNVLWLMVA